MMKTIVKILLAAFVLSLTPTTYVCAQGYIETPAERKARQEREATVRRKKQQQDAAAKRQREEAERKRREAEEQAAREQAELVRMLRELEENMVYVEGGTYKMERHHFYSDSGHQVTLSSFYICKYEVTQELWLAVMNSNCHDDKGAKRPANDMSWNDCQLFLQKLYQLTGKKYRLPTEAEWEYAARGGNISKGYKYAGSDNIDEVAWYGGNSDRQTHEVGLKKPNELGLYDMTGNVDEWCQDWYEKFNSDSQTNPIGPSSGDERVIRGGNNVSDASTSLLSWRWHGKPGLWHAGLGLRLAL